MWRRGGHGQALLETCHSLPAASSTPAHDSGFRVEGSGVKFKGLGFRFEGSGFRSKGSEFKFKVSGFRFKGSGLGVEGSHLSHDLIVRPHQLQAVHGEEGVSCSACRRNSMRT